MKTTIDLPAPLLRKVAAKAEKNGQTLPQFVASTLRKVVFEKPSASSRNNRLQVPVLKLAGKFKVNPTSEQLNDF
jgi:hypothetical protein